VTGLLELLIPERRRPPRAPEHAKASYGVGQQWMTYDQPLATATRSDSRRMWDAQAVYLANRHVRKAEHVIGQRFSTVPWHLEDDQDAEVGDDSPPELRAVRDLMEHPYSPRPGDPMTATPRTRSALWKLTCRHMGVCGMAFWYLDQAELLGGTPHVPTLRNSDEVLDLSKAHEAKITRDRIPRKSAENLHEEGERGVRTLISRSEIDGTKPSRAPKVRAQTRGGGVA
jgi:hypothetical protein